LSARWAKSRVAGAERKLAGKEEAQLVATACAQARRCGPAPWTLELLADELVRLTAHKSGRTVTVDLLEDGLAESREGLAEGEMVAARAGAFASGRRSCASDRY